MIDWKHESISLFKRNQIRSRPRTNDSGKQPPTYLLTERTPKPNSQAAPTNIFVHEPLETNRRHIRLIRVWKCTPSSDPKADIDFHCTINTYTTDEAPPYIALSYTWGAPSPTRVILINGKSFAVRENLYNFLNTFKSHEHVECALWVDQLCIDQTNTLERNHQVGIMTSIYRRSRFVISWLGLSAQSAAQELKSGKHEGERTTFKLLHQLLSNRYFTRVWIVQEVLLARRVHIVCGDVYLGWDQIRRAILSVSTSRYRRLPRAKSLFLGKEEKYTEETWASEPRRITSLRDCVVQYSSLDCQDPRDKVYGLLGLVDTVFEQPVFDYNKSLQEVYLDTVKIFLSQGQENYTFRQAAWDALVLGRNMDFPKKDLKALMNLFSDISDLSTISAIGLKSSNDPMSHWWWYGSIGERYYYHGDGRFFVMRELVGAGQNLSYNIFRTEPARPKLVDQWSS